MKKKGEKTIRSKITKITIIVMTVIVLNIFLIIGLWNCFYTALPFDKSHNVEISSDTISNIPFGGDDLVKIGDKLYYNYEPTTSLSDLLSYGLYEISSTGSKRVYWNGFNFHTPESSNLFPLVAIDGEVVKKTIEINSDNTNVAEIYKLEPDNGGFSIKNQFETETSDALIDFKYIDGSYFIISLNSLYVQNGQCLNKVIDIGYHGELNGNVYTMDNEKSKNSIILNYFYFTSKDEFYYIKSKGNRSWLCNYSIPNKTETEIQTFELTADGIMDLIIIENKAVLSTYPEIDIHKDDKIKTRLYIVDLHSNTSPIEILENFNLDVCISGIDGNIFVGSSGMFDTDKGIYSVNLDTPESHKKIYDGQVASIYILDKMWIYFTNEEKNLYRITHDGKTMEKVFG